MFQLDAELCEGLLMWLCIRRAVHPLGPVISHEDLRTETFPPAPSLRKHRMLFITSLNKTLTENRPLGLPQIGKMGNVIAAQLVTGLMCLMSQFSQAQRDRMWCHRNKGLGWWWRGGHTRPCWDAAEGRNIWQDKKATLWHLMLSDPSVNVCFL